MSVSVVLMYLGIAFCFVPYLKNETKKVLEENKGNPAIEYVVEMYGTLIIYMCALSWPIVLIMDILQKVFGIKIM